MLNAVLREIRAAGGDEAVKAVFERIGEALGRAARAAGEATAA
jgi:predicted ArsR family transcriptional regulator